MTPKRIRLIAMMVRRGVVAHTASTEAMAQELEEHACELEDLQRGTRREVRLKEPLPLTISPMTPEDEKPRTVFGDIETTFPKASEGMR